MDDEKAPSQEPDAAESLQRQINQKRAAARAARIAARTITPGVDDQRASRLVARQHQELASELDAILDGREPDTHHLK